MLLSGSGKSIGSSTLATTNASTRPAINPVQKKKDNFFVYVFKRTWSLMLAFWARLRKFTWIGSTGFILMVVPFVFSYMQEIQNEMMRLDMQNRGMM